MHKKISHLVNGKALKRLLWPQVRREEANAADGTGRGQGGTRTKVTSVKKGGRCERNNPEPQN